MRIRITPKICVAALLAAIAAGCSPNDNTVISNAVDTHKTLSPAVMNDADLSNYLQSIGTRVILAAKKADAAHQGPDTHFDSGQDDAWMFSNQMQFHLVNSKTLNAFTTGGEHMYIYNALFQQCSSEDELAAVMSHEYAHVYCRHVAQGQKHQMETLITGAVVGGAAGYLGGGDAASAQTGATYGQQAGGFLNMGFTRKDEAQADEYGFKFYTAAGWDPKHFGDFFQKMIDLGYDKTPGYMSDHPTLASRVDAANRSVKALGANVEAKHVAPIADAGRFGQLKAKAASLAKTLPDDTSLQKSQQLLQALPRSCVAPVDPPDAVAARQALAAKAQRAQGGR